MTHGVEIGLSSGVYLGLLVAGLAGSLHCLGMCGPILLAFGEARGSASGAWQSLRSSLGYHAGRVWTYGLLGLLAGWTGAQLRLAAGTLGWQRPLAFVAAGAMLLAGLVALGALPGVRFDVGAGGCLQAIARRPWLGALARGHSLLLGAVMGLLPCGLVYGALVVAAALPTPWHSAIGMILFGVGTVPALAGLVVSRAAIPNWLLARSSTLAGVMLLGAGLVILLRAAF